MVKFPTVLPLRLLVICFLDTVLLHRKRQIHLTQINPPLLPLIYEHDILLGQRPISLGLCGFSVGVHHATTGTESSNHTFLPFQFHRILFFGARWYRFLTGWGAVNKVPPMDPVSTRMVVIFNSESLVSVGIYRHCAVFWFMRKMFEPESRRRFIGCFCPLI